MEQSKHNIKAIYQDYKKNRKHYLRTSPTFTGKVPLKYGARAKAKKPGRITY